MGMLHTCGIKRGDSGGPIYKAGVAYGLITHRVGFQGVKTAEAELNVSVVTR